jgi:hypothetical protein
MTENKNRLFDINRTQFIVKKLDTFMDTFRNDSN